MKSFFALLCFLGLARCAHPPRILSRNHLSSSYDDNSMPTTSLQIMLMSRGTTCDPSLIKLRTWNFERTDDVTDAKKCLDLCVEQGSHIGISAMLEVADTENKIGFFQHAVSECLALKKASLAGILLASYPTYPLSLEVFQKVRGYECKDALLYLMKGWRYRYPSVSPLDVVDEIVASCVHFNDAALLHAYLYGCPFISAGTIKAFEDAVINSNIPIGSAILKSNVLGCGLFYARMSPGLAKWRQAMRSKTFAYVMKGNVLHLHSQIGEVEIPFVIQMMAKSVHQPRSFVYLINRFGSSLLKGEALGIYKAACVSGYRDVFRHAFKAVLGHKYDLPLLHLALRSGSRLDPVQVIDYAVSLQYKPRQHEITRCLEVMLNDTKAPALLMKTWPHHLSIPEVFELFPKLIRTGHKETILAAIRLCKQSHLFTRQRNIAFNLMGAADHRGLALQQLDMIQQDPDLLRAVLSTLDPRLFGCNGYASIDFYVNNLAERSVQTFLRNSPGIFQRRIQRCTENLLRINAAMKKQCDPDRMLMVMYIKDGGSWEELVLLAVQNPGQEMLLRTAIERYSANPFIVDPQTKLELLDCPTLSNEGRDIISMAQNRALSMNRKLALLWLVHPLKDSFFLIVEKYRLLTVDAHRRAFNHSS